jgi:hypothetical protein
MFSFYQFNLTNTVIVFAVAFMAFYSLKKLDKKEENNNVRNGIISFVLGIIISLIVSRATVEGDEISTGNYWESKE